MTKKVRHVLSLSGGKDSTALAVHMRDRIPEMEYVFCDTQKELVETYEYLARIEAFLGKRIVRLASAEDGGRGFDHHLEMFRGYLPSPKMRWCTRKLKIEPFEQYIGEDPVLLYIGIRADENREGYISTKPNITPVYPFKTDGITKPDVFKILEDSGLGVPEYYKWRTRSGCYFCFFQRKIEWVGLLEKHPDLYKQAMEYERPEEGYTWVQKESLAELAHPERVAQIKEEEVVRREREKARRRPRTLAEAFGGEIAEDDSEGCTICHV
jgi:hypothetical protein